jgi:D-glycero-D-manno-heptose 1,7-bisphosphate phosphatase
LLGFKVSREIFLDRDGVINRAVVRNRKLYPQNTLQDLEILPDVPEALNLLKESGFLLIVVTNQPDVGRGIQKKETVEEMHLFLKEQLPLDDIYVCWQGQDGECKCRKPLPGMLLQASKKYSVDFQQSYLIGDRWKDIEAGKTAGCKTIFLDYHYNELLRSQPDFTATSTRKASEWIVSQKMQSVSCLPFYND